MPENDLSKVIRSLNKHQRETLGRICMEENTNMYHPATIAKLERLGLIASREAKPGGRFPMTVKMWGPASWAVHIAWCEWCSEHVAAEGKVSQ